MQAPIRKRVTRVGSGAWSIYLPKKWIDQWEPEQQEGREVDLRTIGDSILITPVVSHTHYNASLPSQPSTLRIHLLSAYVRGYHVVNIEPVGGPFDNDTIAASRDFLRHLDERIEATCTPEAIGFKLRADLPAAVTSGDALLQVMGAKVDEAMALAGEAVAAYRHDTDRTLHALRLLRDTHEEDVSRLFHQATRLVATLEIPMASVSSYQLLGLAAADLHRISEQCMRMGEAVLLSYGLTRQDLDYPRDHLKQRIRQPRVPEGPSKDFLRIARDAFGHVQEKLRSLIAAIIGSDRRALASISTTALDDITDLRRRIFEAATGYWGAGGDAEQAFDALDVTRHTTALVHILDHIRAMAETSLILLAAEEGRQP